MCELGRGLFILLGGRTGDNDFIKSASRLVNFFGLFDTIKSAFTRFMCTVVLDKILCRVQMGAFFSSASSRNVLAINTENVIKVMSETIVANSSKTVTSTTNVNEATLEVGPNGIVTGNIDITQKIDLRKEISGQIDSQVILNLQTKIIDELKLAADQAAKAETELFSFGDSESENITNIKKRLEQSVSDVLRVENYLEIVDTTLNRNDAKIVINGVFNGDINIKQGIYVDIVIRNVLTSIVNRTNQILQESGSDIRLSQNAEASNKGLNDIVKNIVNGSQISSIISAVILCIIIISLLFVALSPSGQKGLNKASNAAAARYGGGAPMAAAAPASLAAAPAAVARLN